MNFANKDKTPVNKKSLDVSLAISGNVFGDKFDKFTAQNPTQTINSGKQVSHLELRIHII